MITELMIPAEHGRHAAQSAADGFNNISTLLRCLNDKLGNAGGTDVENLLGMAAEIADTCAAHQEGFREDFIVEATAITSSQGEG